MKDTKNSAREGVYSRLFKVSNIEIVHETTDSDVLSGLVSDRVRALSVYNGRSSAERIVQVSISVPATDPLEWLSKVETDHATFWSSRDSQFAAAGAEYALKLSGETDFFTSADRERMTGLLAEADGDVRFYGGLRFNPAGDVGAEWEPFNSYSFVIPRFELLHRDGTSRFKVNLLLPDDFDVIDEIVEAIPHMLAQIDRHPDSESKATVRVASRTDHPNRSGWKKNIDWALSAFSRSRLGKVVLARRSVYALDETLDGARALAMLKQETPDCFHFLFSPVHGTAFVGASPERLLSIQDRKVVSEAVAGTRPRGIDESNDARLRDELLHSEKDQREHQFVRMTIKDTLSNYCDVLLVDNEAKEMILSRGRHLVSHIEGILRRETDTLNVIRDLHPTAAVGGYPTSDAMDVIEGLEPFDRGWYAGPVGWIGAASAEFAVAIRSGLIIDRELSLYTGAGIVGGSNADSEWNEIEQKLQDFVQVFGLDESS